MTVTKTKILCLTALLAALHSGCRDDRATDSPAASSSSPAPAAPTPLPASPGFTTRKISVGSRTIVVEIADSDSRRERGLMYRQSMGQDEGMLFIFDGEAIRRFWMRNTRIPLSIAYIDAKKTIIDIQDMQPAPDAEAYPPHYPSRGPAMYALEMNLGWFARNNVKIGDKLALH